MAGRSEGPSCHTRPHGRGRLRAHGEAGAGRSGRRGPDSGKTRPRRAASQQTERDEALSVLGARRAKPRLLAAAAAGDLTRM